MRAAGLGVLCAVFVVGAVAIGGTMSGTKKLRADATVTQIDRTCSFVIKATKEVIEDDCNSTGEFASVKADKSKQNIVGKAKVHVIYTSPVDQTTQTAVYSLSSRDPEFFTVRADDTVKVRFDPEHPEQVTLD